MPSRQGGTTDYENEDDDEDDFINLPQPLLTKEGSFAL